MKRKTRVFNLIGILLVICLLCGCLAGCGGAPDKAEEPETNPEEQNQEAVQPEEDPAPEQPVEEDPVAVSETAMENFVNRLAEGNYTIDAAGYMKTNVYGTDQVSFLYEDELYDDYAYMTYGGETFYGLLTEDAVSDIAFITTGSAVDAATSALPNFWITFSSGNLFELFYNNPDKPLEFVTHDDTVKMTLMRLAGYGEAAYNKMQDIYMEFDAAEPTTVHFTAEIEDDPVVRIYFDDLDLTLRFDGTESDPRIDRWLQDPVYPETKTAWDENDLFVLNSVFLPGYGQDAIPFPAFASYAMLVDEDAFNAQEMFRVTDAHGTQENVESYKAALLEEGFREASLTQADGSEITVYRRLLREEYGCYASVYPYYDNGFVLEAGRYYDNPAYDGLEAINEVIARYGFAELPDSEQLSDWHGTDTAAERTESWLYFFEYELSLFATARFEDPEALNAYLEQYGALLAEEGYEANLSMDPDLGEEVLDYYETADGAGTFRYTIEDDTVVLQFRVEKNISIEEAESRVLEAGFPEISFSGDVFCRDIARYYKMVSGFDGMYLSVSQPFDSQEEAEAFLDAYTAALEDADYYYTSPDSVGSLKQFVYYLEEQEQYFAFDYFPEEDSALVNIDFVVRG